MTSSPQTDSQSRTDTPWLRHFSKLLVLATLALLFLGGQVKSHDAGLSVPDWPTSYGQNMFTYPVSEWVGGIHHEQLHRIVASSIGLLTVILACWLVWRDSRSWVKFLGYMAVVGVILQGILGGMTVLFVQPAWLSSAHGVLAQSFFIITIFIAYALSRERAARESDPNAAAATPMVKPFMIIVALVFIQLILGAFMRHTESGLALPDFPAMAGGLVPWFNADSVNWVNEWRVNYAFDTGVVLPEVTLGQLWIHFTHRAGALTIVIAMAYTLYRAYKIRNASPAPWRQSLTLTALIGVQVALGITTVVTQRVPVIASIHLATGAVVLGLATLYTFRALPLTLAPPTDTVDQQHPTTATTQKAST